MSFNLGYNMGILIGLFYIYYVVVLINIFCIGLVVEQNCCLTKLKSTM